MVRADRSPLDQGLDAVSYVRGKRCRPIIEVKEPMARVPGPRQRGRAPIETVNVSGCNHHLPEETVPDLDIADCINETCPWSGKPVQTDSLTEYAGEVVGFCNTGCRDKFETAVRHFEAAKVLNSAP